MIAVRTRVDRARTGRGRRARGFSLVELLVALTLSAVVLAATMGVMVYTVRHRSASQARAALAREGAIAGAVLERDLRLAGEGTAAGPSLVAGSARSFTVQAPLVAPGALPAIGPALLSLEVESDGSDPTAERPPVPGLHRVTWRLEGRRLVRRQCWTPPEAAEPVCTDDEPVARHVDDFSLRYFHRAGHELPAPPLSAAAFASVGRIEATVRLRRTVMGKGVVSFALVGVALREGA